MGVLILIITDKRPKQSQRLLRVFDTQEAPRIGQTNGIFGIFVSPPPPRSLPAKQQNREKLSRDVKTIGHN